MAGSPHGAEVLCILYVDIVGSTPSSVSARRSGDEAAHQQRTGRFIEIWRSSLDKGSASFLKGTGDGLIATFKDPLSALRAVVSARRLQEEDSLASSVPAHVGVHVGTVAILPDGDISGPDAALGHRIASCARSGEVLVSDSCASLVRPYLPPEYRLESLGERRLRGFDSPVRLHQLCAPGWKASPGHPTGDFSGLPARLDRFVGRRRETAELIRYVQGPALRCVTIVGPGGCGKTRLALEVGRQAEGRFDDGAALVELEDVSDADSVLARIAAAAGIVLAPNAQPLEAVRNGLAGRHKLFLLDNCEQALSAARSLQELLAALPQLHLLVTSREPLDIRGERVYDLDPLDVPPPDATLAAIRASDSVKLFLHRAESANRHFKMDATNAGDVAAICRCVAGLPLALEIVAAETRHTSISRLRADMSRELLDRATPIRDVSDRQRTLRATLDWTYRNLSEPDQLLFSQLGLFESSFSEDDVYEVCTGADLSGGLRRLRNKSLVAWESGDDARPFRLLVPVREYARERLGKPQGAVRHRFVAAFTRRAQAMMEAYTRGEEPVALQCIQADLENYRTAWRIACEDGDPQNIADLGVPVTFFAPSLARSANLESLLEQTQRAVERVDDMRRLAILFNTRARLAYHRGHIVDAVSHQRASLERLLAAGSLRDIADGHTTLAYLALRAQDYGLAEEHAYKGLNAAREAGDEEVEATSLYVLASVLTPSDLDRAQELAELSYVRYQQRGANRGMAHASLALAAIAEARGEMGRAHGHYRHALNLCWGQREESQIVRCLEAVARFYARYGDHDLAAGLLASAAQAQRRLGMPETAWLAVPHPNSKSLAEEVPSLESAVEKALAVNAPDN